MGKIQDAIRKAQRNHKGSISSTSVSGSLPVDDSRSITQVHSATIATEQSHQEQDWNYRGQKIIFDKQRLIDAGLLDPDHLRKHLAQEYRQQKRTLLANALGDNKSVTRRGNLVMVGSAESGEGKSFVCLNLSMSLAADHGYSVVMVDSDLENPRLSEILGVAGKKGFADLLADPSLDVVQMISSTDVPGLSVLPAGENREHVAELIASDQAAKLFDELANADPRRIVIFDSSAIGSSAAALGLARQIGQILFIVQAGKTPQRSVIDALDKLDCDCPINIVLNQVID